jgi:hypothetical protein
MTPAPPPPAFLDWWDNHPHAYAVTAAEAWACQRYQDQWKEANRDPQKDGEQWWQR